jgi:hypothetical protein
LPRASPQIVCVRGGGICVFRRANHIPLLLWAVSGSPHTGCRPISSDATLFSRFTLVFRCVLLWFQISTFFKF